MSELQLPSDVANLPARLRKRVDSEIRVGEEIRWMAQPILRHLAICLAGIPLGILILAFIVRFNWGPGGFRLPEFENSLLQYLEILCFVGGCALLVWPVSNLFKYRTAYVITNERALIFSGAFFGGMREYELRRLCILERRERPDGSGDLVFERIWAKRDVGGYMEPSTEWVYGFFSIADVRSVEEMIQKIAVDTE